MPHPKWPASLSRFIRCGRLPRGRRCKTLAAHVTTERMRVVTWAPALKSKNAVARLLHVISGWFHWKHSIK